MATTPPRGRAGIGRIVAGSMAAGLGAAAALPFAPFIDADENEVTAGALLGFALGWALLAVLSERRSDQPQRWAVAPALFMALAGGVLLIGSDAFVRGVLSWVWPPALLALAVWTFVRARRQLHSRTRRWLVNPVLALMALAAVGAGYETVRESLDADAFAMPGRLVDVGGHEMHLYCRGSGSPTVVLEPGAGEMSSYLGWVAPAAARDTRVCVYDRAGRGWSEPAEGLQDGSRIASDLHTLLERGGVPGPYVLAGHSFGGLYVLTFAARYAEDVAGMVLVDSTPPATHGTPKAAPSSYDAMGRVSALLSASARLGTARVLGQFSYGSLPPESRGEARASAATASHVASWVDEYVAAGSSARAARSLVDFDAKPLVVLTAGRGSDEDWLAEQKAMAALSTNSVHRVVAEATHASMLEDEDDATAVTWAIADVVASVRTGSPLVGP
jgi:pimeloyl-ACP methyl ester carboxylesterase